MKVILFALLFAPFLIEAQQKGIQFDQALSWEQVKEKAKSEKKYIFLDCYASWCGPCKEMDKNVYPDEKLGEYMNAYFISVKVQMDSSNRDNENVKKWYSDAKYIDQEYSVNAFPTYLFFSPTGEIVHREVGLQSPETFFSLVNNAMDSNMQFYSLKGKFEDHKLDYSKYVYLASAAKKYELKQLADSIAANYFVNYLLKASKEELLTDDNLSFLNYFSNVIKSSDPIFELIERNQKPIDKILYIGFAQGILDKVIFNEEIRPYFPNTIKGISSEPPWVLIAANITRRFNKTISDRVSLNAQISWHYYKKAWAKLIPEYIKLNEVYGIDTIGAARFQLNNMIYSVIFMHSNDKTQLEKGLKWMKILITDDPTDGLDLDTYANLLYKIGRKKEAIACEEKAAILSPLEPEIKQNLELMKKGKPTWPVN